MQYLIFETLQIVWVEGSSTSDSMQDFLGSQSFRSATHRIEVEDGVIAYVDSDDPDYCKKMLLVCEQPVDNPEFEILGFPLFNVKRIWGGQLWFDRRYVAQGVETRVIRPEPKYRALTSAPSPLGGGCSI